jgi:hypothetical protein
MVAAVARALHNHRALEAQEALERGHPLSRGVNRRECAVRSVRKHVAWPEYVTVGVSAPRRKHESRLARVRVRSRIARRRLESGGRGGLSHSAPSCHRRRRSRHR